MSSNTARASLDEAATTFKALGDTNRLRIVQNLAEGPRYVEELTERLGLSASTVSHHLKTLQKAGLVTRTREQYYAVYRLRAGALEQTLADLVGAPDGQQSDGDRRMLAYRQKVLDTFFEAGCVVRLPAQMKKRIIVLAAFAADFETDRDYAEALVDRLIARRYSDYCTVRRLMVDHRFMTRRREADGLFYRRTAKPAGPAIPAPAVAAGASSLGADTGDTPTHDEQEIEMSSTGSLSKDERRRRIREYRERPRTAGIYAIRNRASGRIFLGSGLDLRAPFNRHRMQLDHGSHRCAALQDDWKALGSDAFDCEIVATVDGELDGRARESALAALEAEWSERFPPGTPVTYNQTAHLRLTPQ